MTLKKMARLRIISRPQNLRPAIYEELLLLATVVIGIRVTAHFARRYLGKVWVFFLKIFDARVRHV